MNLSLPGPWCRACKKHRHWTATGEGFAFHNSCDVCKERREMEKVSPLALRLFETLQDLRDARDAMFSGDYSYYKIARSAGGQMENIRFNVVDSNILCAMEKLTGLIEEEKRKAHLLTQPEPDGNVS